MAELVDGTDGIRRVLRGAFIMARERLLREFVSRTVSALAVPAPYRLVPAKIQAAIASALVGSPSAVGFGRHIG